MTEVKTPEVNAASNAAHPIRIDLRIRYTGGIVESGDQEIYIP